MIEISDQPIDVSDRLGQFCQDRCETGAIASFIGLARSDGGEATTLTLEAYPGYTEAQIQRFAMKAAAKFELQDWLIVHRTGDIKVGAVIVLVATASAHRKPALAACDFLMDYLKSRAPFWKKQTGPAGSQWIEPTHQDHLAAASWDPD